MFETISACAIKSYACIGTDARRNDAFVCRKSVANRYLWYEIQ